jgi:hypothetical protein
LELWKKIKRRDKKVERREVRQGHVSIERGSPGDKKRAGT